MKRKSSIVYIACVCCLLAGCLNQTAKDVFVTPVTPDEEETSYLYSPGTYTGEAEGYSGVIRVSVTVTDSLITEIQILSILDQDYTASASQQESGADGTSGTATENQDSGNAGVAEGTGSNAEEQTGEARPDKEPEVISVQGIVDSLRGMVISRQSTALEADLYTGATVSGAAFLKAVQNALDKAMLQ